MEVQFKKGLLDIIVLSALKRGDSYGYKIIQDISPIMEITESTRYSILKRLEIQEILETYLVEHNNRLRKYYKINEKGRKKLKDFIDEFEYMNKIYDYTKENN